jgi:hypothetical protein
VCRDSGGDAYEAQMGINGGSKLSIFVVLRAMARPATGALDYALERWTRYEGGMRARHGDR